jgi:hypothetical protein
MDRTVERMPHALIAISLAAMMMAYSACACAVEATLDGTTFSLSGFGTLGVVHSSDDQADFGTNAMQPKGPGFTSSWRATPDSRLGVQLSAQFTDRLSVVLQAMSQYQSDGTYRPDLEWANIKYQFTPDYDIRVGRIALPTFMYSDSVNVGYSLPYVRIPMEIFAQLPVTHSDGIDSSYRFHVGDATDTVQAFAGRFDSSIPNGGLYNVRDLYGIVDTFEYHALTLHLSYQTLRYTFSDGALLVSKNPQAIATIGASYDPGKWFLSGEWMRAPDDAYGLAYGWYVIGGRRFGSFTPYIEHARASMAYAGTLGLPPLVNQGTNTLGLRWDFMRNVDLKVQLDHTELYGGINAIWINQQPGFRETGTVNILSLAADFVF